MNATVNPLPPRFASTLGAASMVMGPALMSIGDLFHPAESWDARAQVTIVAAAVDRWILAHTLLVVGMLLLVPGILAITRIVALRSAALGYASRVLFLISVGALSAAITHELELGVFVKAAGEQAAITLFEAFDAHVLPVLLPGMFSFFIATGLMVAPLARAAGPFRWPALCFGLGALLIFGEIALAMVILSQIGNVLILIAGIGFARGLRRAEAATAVA